MTDQREPEPGMPTAGRRPQPSDGPPGEAGTVPINIPVRLPAAPDDEATTRLQPVPEEEPTVAVRPPVNPPPGVGDTTRVIDPSPGEEPTVERPRPAPPTLDLEGPTQPLWASPRQEEAARDRAAQDRAAQDRAAQDRAALDLPAEETAAESRAVQDEAAPDRSAQTASGDRGETPPTGPTSAGESPADAPAASPEPVTAPAAAVPPWRRLSSAGALIALLLALFGFTLVVQLRSNDGDEGLATARQEDLVRILSDLEARDSRLQSEISALENSQRRLTSGVAGREAAQLEAAKRADELGLLAGTQPGRGPGLRIVLDRVKASAILNAVQELRGSGGEVMQLSGADGTAVRVVASSYFVDAEGGGILADGERLTGPYTLDVIGSPQTMQPALQIPGGVVASVNSGGGSVTLEQRSMVEVTAVRKATTLQYARPVS